MPVVAVAVFVGPAIVRAMEGKKTTESTPAATRAAPVTGRMASMATPMVVAVTMNGSVVA
jgi:hypothetical protein